MPNPEFSRRTFLGGAVAVGALVVAGVTACGRQGGTAAAGDWPDAAAWRQLNEQVGGRLSQPTAPWASLTTGLIPPRLRNPWYLEEQPGATQSTGMHKAWVSTPSSYAVAAEGTKDIVAAVNFAREQKVRLVVKGTGHDYFGRSCAPNSLLVWTHNMRDVVVHDTYQLQGAPAGTAGVPAVSVAAGNRWLEAYKTTTAADRYIQGGGCTSVGACGGFALGGGFGSYSKRFGSGAGGILEMEVVTADGNVLIANKYQNDDLFWALRGGGGGTFGIVTRMTLLSHPIPSLDGYLSGSITANSDVAYRELIQRYLEFVPAALNNPSWGEGVTFVKGANQIVLGTAFLDLSASQAEAVWAPFLNPLRARPKDFKVETKFGVGPFKDKWNPDAHPKAVTLDDRAGAPAGYFWWTGNGGEVGAYWGAYQGRGVPLASMQGGNVKALAEAFFNASRTSLILFQTNKAMNGEHPEALARDVETSMNPAVFDNAAFVTLGAWVQDKYVGVTGHEPDQALAQTQADDVNTAMAFIKSATPGGASYTNEGNYFETAWQSEFWGTNYPRLLSIKGKYDPTNLFQVHHGVGSDI